MSDLFPIGGTVNVDPHQTVERTTGDVVSSDVSILDLLRKHQSLTVRVMSQATRVTATAVRQRLNRLMAQGLVHRSAAPTGRGRPSHRYQLTAAGRRQTGANFADLAFALWEEIRSVRDPEVRRGLLQRISRRLADVYANQIRGETLGEKMDSLAELFSQRRIPFEVDHSGSLPVLTALACPYPELAEQDRGICAMEKQLLTDVLGENIRLASCRLDGGSCCEFQPGAASQDDSSAPDGKC